LTKLYIPPLEKNQRHKPGLLLLLFKTKQDQTLRECFKLSNKKWTNTTPVIPEVEQTSCMLFVVH